MRFARNCARCVRAIRLQNYTYRRLKQTDLRSEFRRSATIRSTTFTLHYFRTEATPRCSSLSEPPSKREPPRFARRLKTFDLSFVFVFVLGHEQAISARIHAMCASHHKIQLVVLVS